MDRIENIYKLSKQPLNIRNICLLAHVDHGKTTFADYLVASNGIIMHRTAGKLRYMDNKKEEQDRGITIKSSVISLVHFIPEKSQHYLINLIDSPGHIDFNNEVSAAIRLCEGAVILIDVIEGLCPQTQTVLKQAFNEEVKIILMFNKMDRLIIELKLTTQEAYVHLLKLLDEVNSFLSELISSDILNEVYNNADVIDCDFYENIYFSPIKGNVLFASALDGWCFNLSTFASIYEKKLGFSQKSLEKTLWGDYYINSKEKTIKKGALDKKRSPLFVSLILDNIWNLYNTILIEKNVKNILKIFPTLGIKQPLKDITSFDPRFLISNIIFQQWLPIHKIFLDTVCNLISSPLDISDKRFSKLININLNIHNKLSNGNSFLQDLEKYKHSFRMPVDLPDTPLVAFVSKIFKVDRNSLHKSLNGEKNCETFNNIYSKNVENSPIKKSDIFKDLEDRKMHVKNVKMLLNKDMSDKNDEVIKEKNKTTLTGEEDLNCKALPISLKAPETFEPILLALCKIYAGTLSVNKPSHSYYIINSSVPPSHSAAPGTPINVKSIYYMTGGDDMIAVSNVTKGNVVAIELGILNDSSSTNEVHITTTFGLLCRKYFTLSSDPDSPSFSGLSRYAEPLLNVALEPKKLSHFSVLHKALQVLVQSDPSAQFRLDDKGQLVLMVVGEVHLEHCLLEISEMFPDLELSVSEPIVSFRETIFASSLMSKKLPINTKLPGQVVSPTEKSEKENGVNDKWDNLSELALILKGMDILTPHNSQNEDELHRSFVDFDIEAIPIPTSIVNWLNHNKSLMNLDNGPRSDIELTQDSIKEFNDICQKECHCRKSRAEKFKAYTNLIDQIGNKSDSDDNEDNLNEHDHNEFNDSSSVHSSTLASSKPYSTSQLSIGLKIHDRKTYKPAATKRYYRRLRKNRFCCCSLKFSNSRFGTSQSILFSDHVWSLNFSGDNHSPNLLINSLPFYQSSDNVLPSKSSDLTKSYNVFTETFSSIMSKYIESSLISAFTSLSSAGPMAEEPLFAVCFNVRDVLVSVGWSINQNNPEPSHIESSNPLPLISLVALARRCDKISLQLSNTSPEIKALLRCIDLIKQSLAFESSTQILPNMGTNDLFANHVTTSSHGLVSGRVLLAAQETMRKSFMDAEPRLAMAVYDCRIQTKVDALGKMYSVLNKRYGRVINEEAHEGTQIFSVKAFLPVVESFGFAQELRTKTSGLANPELQFSHWEILEDDPFQKYKLNLGINKNTIINTSSYSVSGRAQSDEDDDVDDMSQLYHKNRAEKYLYLIRKRKGLPTQDKLVCKAEKQRTLTKNK